MEGGEFDRHGRPIEDRRLILVTDLGFFVKAAKDGSRDVFVQSIKSGLPVAGARVALVGANGLNAFTATTDATGKAAFAPTPRDFPREKLPQMVLVERDSDMAFMPFRTNRRTLETSRALTPAAWRTPQSAQQLSTLSLLGSRHLSPGRDDAPRIDYAERGLALRAGRASGHRRNRRSAWTGREQDAVVDVGRRVRRSQLCDARVARRPARTSWWRI